MKRDCNQREAGSARMGAVSFMADANVERNRPRRVVFKLDSGCSDHVVCDKTVFAILKKMTSEVDIQVAKKGEVMVAKQIGQINATSNKAVLFNIKDVLYVPELRGNLMSVKKLTRAGIEVLFSGSVATLKKDGKLLATGHLRGSFYEIALLLEETDAKIFTEEGRNEPSNGTSVRANRLLRRNVPEMRGSVHQLGRSTDGEATRSVLFARSVSRRAVDPVDHGKRGPVKRTVTQNVKFGALSFPWQLEREGGNSQRGHDPDQANGEQEDALPSRTERRNIPSELPSRPSGRERLLLDAPVSVDEGHERDGQFMWMAARRRPGAGRKQIPTFIKLPQGRETLESRKTIRSQDVQRVDDRIGGYRATSVTSVVKLPGRSRTGRLRGGVGVVGNQPLLP
nr:uncharacterized protein LOC115264232 [Aedes albopictus]